MTLNGNGSVKVDGKFVATRKGDHVIFFGDEYRVPVGKPFCVDKNGTPYCENEPLFTIEP